MTKTTAAFVSTISCAVGFVLGILVGHEATADWFEAVGVWVGALGTVGAIVWAVRSFQIDQAHQRATTLEAFRKTVAADEMRAALVTVRAKPGSLAGDMVSSAMIDITNSTALAATNLAVLFDGQPIVISPPGTVQPHATASMRFQVTPFRIAHPSIAASAIEADLTELVVIQYSLDGRRWERRGRGAPRRL